MMKTLNYLRTAMLTVLAVTAASCTTDEIAEELHIGNDGRMTIHVSTGQEAGTRVAYDDNKVESTGKDALTWQTGDKITIVRINNGAYVKHDKDFVYNGTAGATSGDFTGTPITDAGTHWNIYYPNTVEVNPANGTATLSMAGQIQSGSNSTAHLKNHLLLAATNLTTLEGNCPLTMQNSIMKFDLKQIPTEVGELRCLLWEIKNAAETIKKSISLSFEAGTVVFDGNNPTQDLTAYAAFMPQDMAVGAGETFSVTLIGDKSYKAEKTISAGASYKEGNRYTATINGSTITWGEEDNATMKFTVKVPEGSKHFYIPFPEDNNVEYTPADITVDWGDGNTVNVPAGKLLTLKDAFYHTYANAGEYIISITSAEKDPTQVQIPEISFDMYRKDKVNEEDSEGRNPKKLISIETPLLKMKKPQGAYFSQCSALKSIPSGLFDKNTDATNFNACFGSCTALTSIPKGLFDKNIEATSFEGCFGGCTALTSIPERLFDKNTKATSFDGCFGGCTALTSIPKALFDNNTLVENFNSCFNGCTALTSIPEALFDNNTLVENFNSCFSYCTVLTSIPEALFDKNTKATYFSSCFGACSNLRTVPEGLFNNNTQATNFSSCFSACMYLQLNDKIFSSTADKKRFSGKDMNFGNCFVYVGYFISDESDAGTAPNLWNYERGSGTWNTTGCFEYAKLASTIPTDWGGTK